MKILAIQNCETEGLGLYSTLLAERGASVHVVHAYKEPKFPDLVDFDGILVGGTPISAYTVDQHPFLRTECDFLLRVIETRIPCLGICFGAQVLAQLLGAKVRRNHRMEIGCYQVRVTEDGRNDTSRSGFPDSFPVFHWHGDTFELPAGARLLVEGDDCRNQMFRWNNVVGVQFHLEVKSDDAESWASKYADELQAFGKTKEQVVSECLAYEEEMGKIAKLLIDNFLRLCGDGREGR